MGHTRSNSSTGGTASTTTRLLGAEPCRWKLPFLVAILDAVNYATPRSGLPRTTWPFWREPSELWRETPARRPYHPFLEFVASRGRYETSLHQDRWSGASRWRCPPGALHFSNHTIRSASRAFRSHRHHACA